jgi:hypothetical protein
MIEDDQVIVPGEVFHRLEFEAGQGTRFPRYVDVGIEVSKFGERTGERVDGAAMPPRHASQPDQSALRSLTDLETDESLTSGDSCTYFRHLEMKKPRA